MDVTEEDLQPLYTWVSIPIGRLCAPPDRSLCPADMVIASRRSMKYRCRDLSVT